MVAVRALHEKPGRDPAGQALVTYFTPADLLYIGVGLIWAWGLLWFITRPGDP